MSASDATSLPAITYTAIGTIHSPFTEIPGMPLQAVAAQDIEGSIEIAPAYAAGLDDLDGFSHLIVLYHMHRVAGHALRVTPYLDDQAHGIFATRSPKRPNPIGLAVVRLLRVEHARLIIAGVDMLDGTPVLDVKPYVPGFDSVQTARIGWLAQGIERVHVARADNRFT
jgi:tRNA-Thr(GGU) m(6)t(6)A37 methyltransferase TsaA